MNESESASPKRVKVSGCLVLISCVFVPVGLIGCVVVSEIRGVSRDAMCAKMQTQLMGALIAYSTTEEQKETWGRPSARMGSPMTPGTYGLLTTTRIFEAVAAAQSLPNKLFRCPGSNLPPIAGKPRPGDPSSTWGLETGLYISYALDWAAPADSAESRIVLADRDPLAHRSAISVMLGHSSLMVVFGDAHMRRMPVFWTDRAGEDPRVTEGCDGRPLSVQTAIAPDDDIYCASGDTGDPLMPGKGDPHRAWVK